MNLSYPFSIAVHYDATSAPGRSLPLIATARGSILSLLAPQLRFTVKGSQNLTSLLLRSDSHSTAGTKATFIKYGLDVQEAQLIERAADALTREDFAAEPKEIYGTLYTLDNPSKPITYVLCAAISKRSKLMASAEIVQRRISERKLPRMVRKRRFGGAIGKGAFAGDA